MRFPYKVKFINPEWNSAPVFSQMQDVLRLHEVTGYVRVKPEFGHLGGVFLGGKKEKW